MTAKDFKMQVRNIIDLYTDNLDMYLNLHYQHMLELALDWGATVFLGALKECCSHACLPFFFSDNPVKWRDLYLSTKKQDTENSQRHPSIKSVEDFYKKPTKAGQDEYSQVTQFLHDLKIACRSGRIKEFACV